jgi:hypothetical protein
MNTNSIKLMIGSYARNLLGVVLALITTTMTSSGLASPLDFGTAEWLTVANGLWAAAIPTILRYLNKLDPAFGLVGEVAAKEASKKLTAAAKKASTKKSTKKAPATAKRSVTKKSARK